MARSTRAFTLASKAAVEERNSEYEVLEIPFIDPDVKPEKGRKSVDPRIVEAHFPGDGRMFAIAAAVGTRGLDTNPAGELKKFLSAAMSLEDFRFVWAQIETSRLDIEDDVMPMIGEMMELWAAVPSQQ